MHTQLLARAYYHHHHHQFLNREGRWGTTDNLQPVFSIFPCSPLPSGTCRTPDLSIPWCCLPTSSSVCLYLLTVINLAHKFAVMVKVSWTIFSCTSTCSQSTQICPELNPSYIDELIVVAIQLSWTFFFFVYISLHSKYTCPKLAARTCSSIHSLHTLILILFSIHSLSTVVTT